MALHVCAFCAIAWRVLALAYTCSYERIVPSLEPCESSCCQLTCCIQSFSSRRHQVAYTRTRPAPCCAVSIQRYYTTNQVFTTAIVVFIIGRGSSRFFQLSLFSRCFSELVILASRELEKWVRWWSWI